MHSYRHCVFVRSHISSVCACLPVHALLISAEVADGVLELGGAESEHSGIAPREIKRLGVVVGRQCGHQGVRSEVDVVVGEDPPFDGPEGRLHPIQEKLERYVQAAAWTVEALAVVRAPIADKHVSLVTMNHRPIVLLFNQRAAGVNLPLRVCASISRKDEVQVRKVPTEGGDGWQCTRVVVRDLRVRRPTMRFLRLLPPHIVSSCREDEDGHFIGTEPVRVDDISINLVRRCSAPALVVLFVRRSPTVVLLCALRVVWSLLPCFPFVVA